jgi:hypothetical protein
MPGRKFHGGSPGRRPMKTGPKLPDTWDMAAGKRPVTGTLAQTELVTNRPIGCGLEEEVFLKNSSHKDPRNCCRGFVAAIGAGMGFQKKLPETICFH